MSDDRVSLDTIADRLERLKNQSFELPVLERALYTPLPPSPTVSVSEDQNSISGEEEEEQQEEMANNNANLSMRQLVATTGPATPLCITYPADGGFELKSGMIHYLPIFHGFVGDDPHKHLKGFHMVCIGMKPEGMSEENVKLKAFPFSLADGAREWLYDLPPGSVTTWEEMQRQFLEKYFPASKAANLRKAICGAQQQQGELLCEYWERYKKLCAACPQHQFTELSIMQYFYEGLCPADRAMLDSAAGGALIDKTPTEARTLIATMAAQTQQFGSRGHSNHKVNEVSTNNELLAHIAKLTDLVEKAVIQPRQLCGVCSMNGHSTDSCPGLVNQGALEQVHALGGTGQGQQRPRFDPYSNTYNEGWKYHPNRRWSNNDQVHQPSQSNPPGFYPLKPQTSTYQQAPQSQGTPSIDEKLNLIIQSSASMVQFQQQQASINQHQESVNQEMKKSIENLERSMSQMASNWHQVTQQGVLPSQPLPNPKGGFEQTKSVTLRSGKQALEQPHVTKQTRSAPNHDEQHMDRTSEGDKATTRIEQGFPSSQPMQSTHPNLKVHSEIPVSTNIPSVPFPHRFAKSKKEEHEKSILETFRKVQVNIPLLDAIKQVPKYAKFLKELCSAKRRRQVGETVKVSENVSAVLQRKLPPKCKDPDLLSLAPLEKLGLNVPC